MFGLSLLALFAATLFASSGPSTAVQDFCTNDPVIAVFDTDRALKHCPLDPTPCVSGSTRASNEWTNEDYEIMVLSFLWTVHVPSPFSKRAEALDLEVNNSKAAKAVDAGVVLNRADYGNHDSEKNETDSFIGQQNDSSGQCDLETDGLIKEGSPLDCELLISKDFVLVSGLEGWDLERSIKKVIQSAGGLMVMAALAFWVLEFCRF